MIAWPIEVAKESGLFEHILVSTDDEEIAEISQKWGADVPFLRPVEFATDTAKAVAVVKHALLEMEKLDNCEYPVIVYLEPPAPFKTTEDIDACIELFFEQ